MVQQQAQPVRQLKRQLAQTQFMNLQDQDL